jgi:hypothetical protein
MPCGRGTVLLAFCGLCVHQGYLWEGTPWVQEQLAVCGHTVRSYDQREREIGRIMGEERGR